jgi:hypothetical protein
VITVAAAAQIGIAITGRFTPLWHARSASAPA